jgi:hypothetical protein
VVSLDIPLHFFSYFAGYFLEMLRQTLGFHMRVVGGLNARLFRYAKSLGVRCFASAGRKAGGLVRSRRCAVAAACETTRTLNRPLHKIPLCF